MLILGVWADFVEYKISFILDRLLFRWILRSQKVEKIGDWNSEDILGIET